MEELEEHFFRHGNNTAQPFQILGKIKARAEYINDEM